MTFPNGGQRNETHPGRSGTLDSMMSRVQQGPLNPNESHTGRYAGSYGMDQHGGKGIYLDKGSKGTFAVPFSHAGPSNIEQGVSNRKITMKPNEHFGGFNMHMASE